jgi:hypothetical protein
MFSQINMGQNLRLEGSQVLIIICYYSCQVKVCRFQQHILWNTMFTQPHAVCFLLRNYRKLNNRRLEVSKPIGHPDVT